MAKLLDMQSRRTVDAFDLIATPDRIVPQYGFIALFLIVGVGLLLVGWIILRLTNARRGEAVNRLRGVAWLMIPFGVVWIAFTSFMGLGEILSVAAARKDVLSGSYRTLEGCLDYFRPGVAKPGKTIAGDERWAVSGHAFRYGAGEIRFAYHKVEPLGGIVHRRSKVRVSFIRDDFLQRDDIVQMIIVQDACPPAPDAPSR
jgi:hypothetical protein